jgi:RNA polymerase sigma-70 factor (ECF subfamily)
MLKGMDVEDSEALVEASRKGSTTAFAVIVRQYQSRVRAYLARYVRDRNAVEDLAQDTFLMAYRGLSTYRAESSLGVWLIGIARNVALMHVREQARRRARESEVLQAALGRWLSDSLESDGSRLSDRERTLSALEQCLAELPEHSSSLVESYYFKGRSVADMAREHGKKDSAIGMMLLRIREILGRCIKLRVAESGANA